MKKIGLILTYGVIILMLASCGKAETAETGNNALKESGDNEIATYSDMNTATENMDATTEEPTMEVNAAPTEDVSQTATNVTDEITTPEITATPSVIPTSEAAITPTEIPTPTELPNPTEIPTPKEAINSTPTPVLSSEELEKKKNSIAMLNHLAVVSQEINSSKNSRLCLEEIYTSLLCNLNPDKVTYTTQSHLSSLLDITEKYRMIDVKRERLQYIYEQNQAKAVRSAIPNPLGLMNAINSESLVDLATSIVYMAVDSITSYNAYNTEIDEQFLLDKWALDDEEAENIHESRKRAFNYMIETIREEQLEGVSALTETEVENFVKWKNCENNAQRLQFFESEKQTYKDYGGYWLTIAECYYMNKQYKETLDAIAQYEGTVGDIFKMDSEYANIMPIAIGSASKIYSGEEYVKYAEKSLDILTKNVKISENTWTLIYFAAQTYLDLYRRTNNSDYIDEAYKLALNSVNALLDEQRKLNSDYLGEISYVSIPETATKEEKKMIEEYNDYLDEKRKTELPGVYEPLVMNLDLLFALAEEKNINYTEKLKIQRIMHGENGEKVFLTKSLEKKYNFDDNSIFRFNAEFNGDPTFGNPKLIIPVNLVSENSIVKAKVFDGSNCVIYDDWKITEVDRDGSDLDSYKVTLKSVKMDAQDWKNVSKVTFVISEGNDTALQPMEITFDVEYTENWGPIPDSVSFRQVK